MATANAIGAISNPKLISAFLTEDGSLISGLSRTSAAALDKASARQNFHPGELVYTDGEQSTGAYIVRRGKVKLVANSSDGKALILRIALPGEIIGLSAALSARASDTSAEVIEPTTVSYIKTQALYQLMDSCGDLALRLAQELSAEYSSLCQELSTLGLQRSAMSRLAKLLVGLAENVAPQRGDAHITCQLTHEEMAQMIGTSRETVTRLLRELRDQQIAVLKNDVLTVHKLDGLRALID